MPRLTSLPVDDRSPFQKHLDRWKDGCGNSICDAAARKCFSRGKLPCDVLFVGEAPGDGENVIGRPFVGPAGRVLDDVVRKAMPLVNDLPKFRTAFTNLVLCLPREEDGSKAHEAMPDEVATCAPRLQEFVAIARPRLVVCVGKQAWEYLEQQGCKHTIKLPKLRVRPKIVAIVHPAAILRAPQAQQGLMEQRAVVILRNALEELE